MRSWEERLEDKEKGCIEGPIALQIQRIHNKEYVFQNDRIFYDENGERIKDKIVYKDFVRIPISL